MVRLGVGLLYQPALHEFLLTHLDAVDFVEVVPDTLWTDGGEAGTERTESPAMRSFLERLHPYRPIVPHGIGLSLGSAHRLNEEHLEAMRRWESWLGFPWHSEHLAFNLAEVGGTEVNLGLMMPLPLDEEMLGLLVERIGVVQHRVAAPFALETNADAFRWTQDAYSPAKFLNELCARTACHVLLDLHNLWANSRNLGESADVFLHELDLSHVIEIHVAGGFEHDGFYFDAHSGPVPEPVWDLLEQVLPRCANVRGVTFELLGSWYEPMGEKRLAEELARLRETWSAAVGRSVLAQPA